MKPTAAYIKSVREKLGLTQQDFADKLGITRELLNKIESGKRSVSKATAVLLKDFEEKVQDSQIEDDIENSTGLVTESIVPYGKSYIEKRREGKNKHEPFMVPFVPVKAQAGYVKAIDQEIYLDTLEKFQLLPGVDPHGAIWRYWEVEGDSMKDAFKSGDILLTSQVHQFDWDNVRNFYVYVIVTADRVLLKRVYCKNILEWVLISENEENYPQQLLPVEYIKELWVFRRKIDATAPPSKRFEIKV